MNDCYDDPDAEYAWCSVIDLCRMEETCCMDDCDGGDEECYDDCEYYAGLCRHDESWTGSDNLHCKTETCWNGDYGAAYGIQYCYDNYEAGSAEYDTCWDNAVDEYYDCVGPLSCEQRYVNVCQEVCGEAYDTYSETCYTDCASYYDNCVCEENIAECKTDCDGDGDCEGDCDTTYPDCAPEVEEEVVETPSAPPAP